MRNFFILLVVIVFGFSANVSCKNNNDNKKGKELSADISHKRYTEILFDSTLVKDFFIKHPKLVPFQTDVEALYQKHRYHYIWYDQKGINELGDLLYNKINNLAEEGIQVVVSHKIFPRLGR